METPKKILQHPFDEDTSILEYLQICPLCNIYIDPPTQKYLYTYIYI